MTNMTTDKRNIQIKTSPDFKRLVWKTSMLAGYRTLSRFIRHALLKEVNDTLRSLSLNNEVNGLIDLAQKLQEETKRNG